jgi:PAS domain S-box-containing protein
MSERTPPQQPARSPLGFASGVEGNRNGRPADPRWRTFFEHTSDAVFIYQLDEEGRPGTFVDVNPAAESRYGYTREELLAMSSPDLVDEVVVDIEHSLEQLHAAGYLVVESQHVAKDGRKIPVEVHLHQFCEDGEEFVLGICRDLSARRAAEQAVRDRDRTLVDTLDRISDDFAVLDHDWRIRHVNRRAADAVGMEKEQMIGKNVWELFPTARDLESSQMVASALESGEPLHFETLSELTGRWLAVSLYPTADGMSIFARDESERKRADEAMKAYARRMRQLAEASLEVASAESLDEKLQAVTEHARAILDARHAAAHLDPAGDGGTTYAASDATPGIQAPPPERLIELVSGQRGARRVSRADVGARQPGEGDLLIAPLLDRHGTVSGVVYVMEPEGGAFTEDDEAILAQLAQLASSAIEAARAEEARLMAAERLRFLAEAMPQKVFTANAKGELDYFNRRWFEYTGLGFDSLKGFGWEDVVHEDDRAANVAAVQHALDQGEPLEIEHRIRAADGRYRWHITRAEPMRDASGAVTLWVGTNTDIHDLKVAAQDLRESESRFRTMSNAAPVMIWMADPAGNYTWVNRRWQAFTGCPLDLARSDARFDRIHPDEAGPYREAFGGAVTRREPFRMEYRLRRFDGEHRWVIDEATPLYAPDGTLRGFIGTCVDVDDQKRVEQALRDSESRFRAIVSQATVGVAQTDLEGRFTYVNAGYCQITGYSEAELYERRMQDLTHPDDVAELDSRQRQALASGEPFVLDQRYVRPDGTPIWVNTSVTAVVDERGRPNAILAVTLDISKRRQHEEALRDSEERYRALVEATTAIVWMASPDGRLQYCSPQWYDYTGLSEEQSRDYGWTRAVEPQHREHIARFWRRIASAQSTMEIEVPLRRRDGSVRWHIARGVLLRDEVGEPVRWIGSALDIHDRKQAQEQLERLNVTLEDRVAERTAVAERQAEQLRQLAAELTRTEQNERRRLATTLHDHLQQLLVAAKFRLRVAENRGGQDTALILQIDELIDQSIEVSRSLTVELSPPVLRDAGLCPALEWLARWMSEKHHLTVDVDLDEAAEPADEHVRVILFEAARELLFNVAKHARVDEARVVLAPYDDQHIQLMIIDSGIGFDPGERSASGPGVAGIGLRSIRERIGYFGGRVDVDARPGGGTTATLVAPRQAAPLAMATAFGAGSGPRAGLRFARDGETAASPASQRTIRVLLADDHKILRDGLASLLSDAAGVEVVGEAQDGVEAVELALELQPDVVVMDITMPRMNGVEATRKITSALPGIRVIGLSMHNEADMASALEQAGAAMYLTKGGPAGALIDAIRGEGGPPAGS